MTNSIQRLARKLAKAEQLQAESSQPQLAYSSIEDGRLEEWYGDTQGMVIGAQHDGTHVAATLTGPKPEPVAAPALEPVAGGLRVLWSGLWADPLGVAPMDFLRVDIVASTDPGFDPIATPPQASIVSPRGGEVFLALPAVEHYVALVARTLPGKASDPSEIVSATPLATSTGAGGIKTYATELEPQGLTSEDEGALWLHLPNNILHRWDGVEWVEFRDVGITTALSDAAAAQADADAAASAAATAQQTADDAEADALNALGVAQGKADIVYQATAPTGDPNVYWVDTDTGRGHRWDGASWLEIQDADVQTALSDAATAQSAADTADAKAVAAQSAADTADAKAVAAQQAADDAEAEALNALGVAQGKADIVYQAAAPAGDPNVYWVDTDTGRGHRWDGSNWLEIQDADVQTALSEAAAADAKAVAAQSDADQALSDAAFAQATADGKIVTFYAPNANPPVADGVGDLWSVEDKGNLTRRWNGSEWVNLPIGDESLSFSAFTGVLGNSIQDPLFHEAERTADRLAGADPGWDIETVTDLPADFEGDTTGEVAKLVHPADTTAVTKMLLQADVSVFFGQRLGVMYATQRKPDGVAPMGPVRPGMTVDFKDAAGTIILSEQSNVLYNDDRANSDSNALWGLGDRSFDVPRGARSADVYVTTRPLDASTPILAGTTIRIYSPTLSLVGQISPAGRGGKTTISTDRISMDNNGAFLSVSDQQSLAGMGSKEDIFNVVESKMEAKGHLAYLAVNTPGAEDFASLFEITDTLGRLWVRNATTGTFQMRLNIDQEFTSLRSPSDQYTYITVTDDGPFVSVPIGFIQEAGPGLFVKETWHTVGTAGEPGYENGWADNPNGEGSYFRKDATGTVWAAFNVSVPATAQGTRMFQLPLGYRPGRQISSSLFWQNTSGPRFGTLNILTDGSVMMFHAGNGWGTVATGSFQFPAS